MLGEDVNTRRYSIEVISVEARHLIEQGILSRHQPIYTLCHYIPASQWHDVEDELERHDFLLRDRLADLLGHESWTND